MDLRGVVDPVHRSDYCVQLVADHASYDGIHGFVEDGSVEGLGDHEVDVVNELGDCSVDGRRCILYPAEYLLVDLKFRAVDVDVS